MAEPGGRLKTKKVRDLFNKKVYEVVTTRYDKTLQGEIVTIFDPTGNGGFRDILPDWYEYMPKPKKRGKK